MHHALPRRASAFVVLALAFLSAAPLAAQSSVGAAPAPPAPTTREALVARALASPVPAWLRGDLLVDRFSRGLYTYNPDKRGSSVCDLNCRRYWPPLYAEPGDRPVGPFTIATGPEGRPIWAWQGKPLYRWTGDRSRGSARGEIVDEWLLVRVPRELRSQVVSYFPMPAAVAPPAR